MNVPLWWGMLIMGDACMEAEAILLPQLFYKPKTALKLSLEKKKINGERYTMLTLIKRMQE